MLRRTPRAHGDPREVVRDDDARYFGAHIDDASLTAGAGARVGTITLERWLAENVPAR